MQFKDKYRDITSRWPSENDSLYRFVTQDQGESYNGCHFWTNFEIASLDLWRSNDYLKLFNYLDQSGGFFYERWGDAPVHSIAASLMLSKDEFHFFNDIGYRHSAYSHCPTQPEFRDKCTCDPKVNMGKF
jgi:alpha 1,2-mannosyltransferase